MLPLLYRHKYRADDNEFPLWMGWQCFLSGLNTYLWHQPAELGFGLNVPDTISPRLEEEFPLDLLLQRYTANRKREERNVLFKHHWPLGNRWPWTVFRLRIKYLWSIHTIWNRRGETTQASDSHHWDRGKRMALNMSHISPHLMEHSVVATIQAHLWEAGPHNIAWLSSTSFLPYLPAHLPGFTHPQKPSNSPHPFWSMWSSLQFLLLLIPLTTQFSSCPALQLTRGSVLSSVPAGVGCFPASEGSGWSRFHSLLSPDGQSTSHCWTSTDWRDKKTTRLHITPWDGECWVKIEKPEIILHNLSLKLCVFG